MYIVYIYEIAVRHPNSSNTINRPGASHLMGDTQMIYQEIFQLTNILQIHFALLIICFTLQNNNENNNSNNNNNNTHTHK